MSSKNKPVPYIDTQTTSNSPAPVVLKTRFNPYTGGILSNAEDRPTFGKYTMEIRSTTKYISSYVNFKWKQNSSTGTWSFIKMQIPLPVVKLFVKNPNYDIMDSIVYLALDEDALSGADNGGNFDQTTRQAKPEDYYISFSPDKSTAVVKSTIVLTINDEIVRLFEKYTVGQFLKLITGKDYEEITNSNTIIRLIQDNFYNIRLYAEAGFNNDSDSTADGYFIRNKLVTRFTFDKTYLDNPKLKSFRLRSDSANIYIDLECENLQYFTFNLYMGADAIFTWSLPSPDFIKTYTIDLNNRTNPTITIPINSLTSPAYNSLDEFKPDWYINNLIYKRKYIGVKITKVVVSSGIEVLAENFDTVFGANPDVDAAKSLEFGTNIPAPTLSTFIGAKLDNKQPYFLDLVSNRRKFYFRIEQSGSNGFDTRKPKDLLGFLIRYRDTSDTTNHVLRFYSFDNPSVTLMRDGYIISGATIVNYYYEVMDYFKYASGDPSFKLDIPYSPVIQVYLVDKYYNISTVPLTLSDIPQYSMHDYFAYYTPFIMSKTYNLETTYTFLRSVPRHTLEFTMDYAPYKPAQPPGNITNWRPVQSGVTYRYTYNHAWASILDFGASPPVLTNTSTNAVLRGIDCSNVFKSVPSGQRVWLRLTLVDKYATSKTLPYTGKILAYYNIKKN